MNTTSYLINILSSHHSPLAISSFQQFLFCHILSRNNATFLTTPLMFFPVMIACLQINELIPQFDLVVTMQLTIICQFNYLFFIGLHGLYCRYIRLCRFRFGSQQSFTMFSAYHDSYTHFSFFRFSGYTDMAIAYFQYQIVQSLILLTVN
jgi:hypothetical protein